MIRVSDARMSGTAYGTCVLHVAPEASAGGPLLYVQDVDFIVLDVESKSLHLEVSDKELENRMANTPIPQPKATSGYEKLYVDHVLQADQGCDLDFLVGSRGHAVPRESH